LFSGQRPAIFLTCSDFGMYLLLFFEQTPCNKRKN
jgi:hypothetical protein